MPVSQIPFRSEYGFVSNGFSVDAQGNVVLRSITQTAGTTPDEDVLADFSVTYGIGWEIEPLAGTNPTITLSRSSSYTFELNNLLTGFYIAGEDEGIYSEGLLHSDGGNGDDAQGKTTGRLVFTVPPSAPDTLLYKNENGSEIGTIEIINPEGVFDTVEIFNTTNATSPESGALRIHGGVGIAKDLQIGGNIIFANDSILQVNEITSSQDINSPLEINGEGGIQLKVGTNLVGSINASGLSIPINNSTIEDTPIGSTTPSTATFVSAVVQNVPISAESITNKDYVDSTALTLAVAFGL